MKPRVEAAIRKRMKSCGRTATETDDEAVFCGAIQNMHGYLDALSDCCALTIEEFIELDAEMDTWVRKKTKEEIAQEAIRDAWLAEVGSKPRKSILDD